MFEAKQTIEKINRGHYRLAVIQHGDGGKNREVQVYDTVEGFMVKGVTERAIIAHILMDARTAAKHFEPIKAKKELEREMEIRRGDKKQGLQRVLDANKGKIKPPKSVTKKGGLPTLRLRKSAAQIQAEGEEAERRERNGEPVPEPTPDVIEEVEEKLVPKELDPSDLASIYEFEDADAEGLFIGVATAVGSKPIEAYLARVQPEGPLSLEFVAEMAAHMENPEESSPVPEVEVVEEKPAPAKKGKKPKVYNPTKK